ncbi:MAG: hypothetical protein OXT67_00675 [Zetaproteobacteria bacterium]|nr:hypothetical protein [Zetaproteobacteria bacterium]
MKENMLQDFIDEECTDSAKNLVLDTIERWKGKDYREEFCFNRFNLYLDFKVDSATLQDELDFYEQEEIMMSIGEFESLLKGL